MFSRLKKCIFKGRLLKMKEFCTNKEDIDRFCNVMAYFHSGNYKQALQLGRMDGAVVVSGSCPALYSDVRKNVLDGLQRLYTNQEKKNTNEYRKMKNEIIEKINASFEDLIYKIDGMSRR